MRIGVGFISKDSFRAWLSYVSRKGGSIVIEGSSSAFTSYVRKRGEPDGRQAGTNDSPTSQSGAAAASNQQPHQVGDTQNNIINLGAITVNSTTYQLFKILPKPIKRCESQRLREVKIIP